MGRLINFKELKEKKIKNVGKNKTLKNLIETELMLSLVILVIGYFKSNPAITFWALRTPIQICTNILFYFHLTIFIAFGVLILVHFLQYGS